jgi:hypothetical protein
VDRLVGLEKVVVVVRSFRPRPVAANSLVFPRGWWVVALSSDCGGEIQLEWGKRTLATLRSERDQAFLFGFLIIG